MIPINWQNQPTDWKIHKGAEISMAQVCQQQWIDKTLINQLLHECKRV